MPLRWTMSAMPPLPLPGDPEARAHLDAHPFLTSVGVARVHAVLEAVRAAPREPQPPDFHVAILAHELAAQDLAPALITDVTAPRATWSIAARAVVEAARTIFVLRWPTPPDTEPRGRVLDLLAMAAAAHVAGAPQHARTLLAMHGHAYPAPARDLTNAPDAWPTLLESTAMAAWWGILADADATERTTLRARLDALRPIQATLEPRFLAAQPADAQRAAALRLLVLFHWVQMAGSTLDLLERQELAAPEDPMAAARATHRQHLVTQAAFVQRYGDPEIGACVPWLHLAALCRTR